MYFRSHVIPMLAGFGSGQWATGPGGREARNSRVLAGLIGAALSGIGIDAASTKAGALRPRIAAPVSRSPTGATPGAASTDSAADTITNIRAGTRRPAVRPRDFADSAEQSPFDPSERSKATTAARHMRQRDRASRRHPRQPPTTGERHEHRAGKQHALEDVDVTQPRIEPVAVLGLEVIPERRTPAGDGGGVALAERRGTVAIGQRVGHHQQDQRQDHPHQRHPQSPAMVVAS